jgi:hypothetical protein
VGGAGQPSAVGGRSLRQRSVWGKLGRVIGDWRLFKGSDPGHRFQGRYHRHRHRRQTGQASKWVRWLNLLGGPPLIVAGFLFLPTPGPSYIIIVVGAWMLAGEWLPLARLFDWTEPRLRKLGRWLKGRWRQWSTAAKVLAVSVCVALLGYGAYYLLFGG